MLSSLIHGGIWLELEPARLTLVAMNSRAPLGWLILGVKVEGKLKSIKYSGFKSAGVAV